MSLCVCLLLDHLGQLWSTTCDHLCFVIDVGRKTYVETDSGFACLLSLGSQLSLGVSIHRSKPINSSGSRVSTLTMSDTYCSYYLQLRLSRSDDY
jgi:hypothetical protein